MLNAFTVYSDHSAFDLKLQHIIIFVFRTDPNTLIHCFVFSNELVDWEFVCFPFSFDHASVYNAVFHSFVSFLIKIIEVYTRRN